MNSLATNWANVAAAGACTRWGFVKRCIRYQISSFVLQVSCSKCRRSRNNGDNGFDGSHLEILSPMDSLTIYWTVCRRSTGSLLPAVLQDTSALLHKKLSSKLCPIIWPLLLQSNWGIQFQESTFWTPKRAKGIVLSKYTFWRSCQFLSITTMSVYFAQTSEEGVHTVAFRLLWVLKYLILMHLRTWRCWYLDCPVAGF